MLFHPAIQFYFNNVSLTSEEAAVLEDEDLTALELEAISTPFFRQLVVNETTLLKKSCIFVRKLKGWHAFVIYKV